MLSLGKMTPKEERILSRLYGPGPWSEGQIEFARKAIKIANDDAVRSRMPRRDIRIGEEFEKKGHRFKCVRRPKIDAPSEACSGCDAAHLFGNCEMPRCSSHDRSDRQNVWFVEVK